MRLVLSYFISHLHEWAVMSAILRPYQQQVSIDISNAWASGADVVCAVLPTGAGKTVIFTHKVAEEQGVTFSMAHRQELVGQISMAHAFAGIEHSVQAPKNVIRWIIQRQVRAFGRHFYQPQAQRIVCSVQTLLNRSSSLSNAINRTCLWVGDEFHHFLRENQWGRAVALFPPGCRGLGVTATPGRADGKGIGRHADGLADTMVIGPNMRQLINAGYLSDYRVFGPYSDIDLSNVTVGSTGDYSKPKLTAAVRQSHIVGDVVQSYQTIAPGRIGVTFVTDVKTGEELAQAYTAAGVPAHVVHAKTPDRERQQSTDMLARGDLKQLVNVDIFGEGYDLPAIETISMARPTESYPLYAQQFGRALRVKDGKGRAVIIDHVKNVERHGLPDTGRALTLDSRDRRSSRRDPDLIPIRTCMQCTAVYESWVKECPYCGYVHVNGTVTRTIEQVEGDLVEIDPETLARLRGEIDRIDAPDYTIGDRLKHAGAPASAVMGAMARHRERQEAQAVLRERIAVWAGYQRAAGGSDRVIHRRFYRSFGVDMITAQTLGRGDADRLSNRVYESIF